MADEPINNEEISSELTGLNKGDKVRKKHQLIIGLSMGGGLVVVSLIIIIVSLSTKSHEDQSNPIGQINCIYNVQTLSEPIPLIGTEFKLGSNSLGIYIDGKQIKYSKEYQFDSRGTHNIEIKIYSKLNMDYMFKDIKDLVSVDMISEKNCQITSMVSSFENCIL